MIPLQIRMNVTEKDFHEKRTYSKSVKRISKEK